MNTFVSKEQVRAAVMAAVVVLGAQSATDIVGSAVSTLATNNDWRKPVVRLFNKKYESDLKEFNESVKGLSEDDQKKVLDQVNAGKGEKDKKIEKVSQLSFRNQKHVDAVKEVVNANSDAAFAQKVKNAMPQPEAASLKMEDVLAEVEKQGYLKGNAIADCAKAEDIKDFVKKDDIEGLANKYDIKGLVDEAAANKVANDSFVNLMGRFVASCDEGVAKDEAKAIKEFEAKCSDNMNVEKLFETWVEGDKDKFEVKFNKPTDDAEVKIRLANADGSEFSKDDAKKMLGEHNDWKDVLKACDGAATALKTAYDEKVGPAVVQLKAFLGGLKD